MFINEFIFSFSLLAFTAVLFLLGMALLLDGTARLMKETRKKMSRRQSLRATSIVVSS